MPNDFKKIIIIKQIMCKVDYCLLNPLHTKEQSRLRRTQSDYDALTAIAPTEIYISETLTVRLWLHTANRVFQSKHLTFLLHF